MCFKDLTKTGRKESENNLQIIIYKWKYLYNMHVEKWSLLKIKDVQMLLG